MKQFMPFMLIVIGGSFLIKEFAKIRYKYRKVTSITETDLKKEMDRAGVKMEKPVPLEEEYERTMKKIDLDDWKNVRIPRLWDEENKSSN